MCVAILIPAVMKVIVIALDQTAISALVRQATMELTAQTPQFQVYRCALYWQLACMSSGSELMEHF